jgi:hypothetical protein
MVECKSVADFGAQAVKKLNSKSISNQTMKNVEKPALILPKMFFISGMYHLLF